MIPKKVIAICYLIYALAAGTVRAEAPQPTVLQTSQVFTDAVEVLDTEPVLNINAINGRMYFLDRDATTWRDFEHPKLPMRGYYSKKEWRGEFIKALNDQRYLYGGSTYEPMVEVN